jgi:signal transduction histidine kinase
MRVGHHEQTDGIALNLNRLRLVSIVAPVTFLAAVEALSIFALGVAIPSPLPRFLVVFVLIAGSTVPFAVWIFRVVERGEREAAQSATLLEGSIADLTEANAQIERRNRQLIAVNASIVAISSALDPPEVLQRIVDSARDLVDANYGALGVADENGDIIQFITSGITAEERSAIGPLPQGHGLLGLLIRERKPLCIDNIREHPASVGFPPNHPPMKTLLGVPIFFQGEVVGDLYMAEKTAGALFDAEDQQVLELLANHAAVAITNARLYQQAKEARDRLQVWNEELEAEVERRARQIERQSHELTRRVLQAQEEERKRIARELHDETAQALSTLLINIDLLEFQLPPGRSDAREGIDRLRTLAKRTLDETRALSHDLRPTILDDVGLVAAVEWFADEISHSFDGSVEVKATGSKARLSSETELVLFRIAQEGMTNAAKYSEAASVRVALDFTRRSARLEVSDNGRGFEPSKLAGPSRRGGLGLYGMRERAELIGASLDISSRPGGGTRITVVAPLDDHTPATPPVAEQTVRPTTAESNNGVVGDAYAAPDSTTGDGPLEIPADRFGGA